MKICKICNKMYHTCEYASNWQGTFCSIECWEKDEDNQKYLFSLVNLLSNASEEEIAAYSRSISDMVLLSKIETYLINRLGKEKYFQLTN